MSPLIELLLGGVVLLAGRRLYWLLVAIAGFLAGMLIVNAEFTGQPAWMTLLVACGMGVLGALVALLLQRLAFALMGLFTGAYLGLAVAQAANLAQWSALCWLIGAALGVLAAVLLTDWALIGLSAAMGAAVIAPYLSNDRTLQPLIVLGLLVLGVVVQARQLRPRVEQASEAL